MMPKPERMLTRSEAAEYLGVGERTVQWYAEKGWIEKIQHGRNLAAMYPESSLRLFREAKAAGMPPGTLTPAVAPQRPQAFLAPPPAGQEEAPAEDLRSLPGEARLTMREAADWLRVSEKWIREQIESGRLPYDLVRGGFVIRKDDLVALPAEWQGGKVRTKK